MEREELETLDVRMLGSFSMTYGTEPVSFARSRNTKLIQLLQILLYHGQDGISREKLTEELYGRGEFVDSSNNLNVAVHRLKTILSGTVLPPYSYIRVKKGIYHWDAPMPTIIDALQFLDLTENMQVEDEADAARLKTACRMYGRGFLPESCDEDWAMIESIRYKKRYEEALYALCDYLMEQEKYEEVLELCSSAIQLYPYDDWQALRMECLIQLDRYGEAMEEYESTARFLQEDMGIEPSDRMKQLLKSIKKNKRRMLLDGFAEAVSQLRDEDAVGGAYCCSLLSFRDNYRIIARRIERNGDDASLMMCSLREVPLEKREQAMNLLESAIKKTLRGTDFYTKCSASQYLILLYGVSEENSDYVFERICQTFSQLAGDSPYSLTNCVAQVKSPKGYFTKSA